MRIHTATLMVLIAASAFGSDNNEHDRLRILDRQVGLNLMHLSEIDRHLIRIQEGVPDNTGMLKSKQRIMLAEARGLASLYERWQTEPAHKRLDFSQGILFYVIDEKIKILKERLMQFWLELANHTSITLSTMETLMNIQVLCGSL